MCVYKRHPCVLCCLRILARSGDKHFLRERFSGVERDFLISLSACCCVSRAALYGLFWAARRCSPLSPRRKGFSFSLVKIMRTTCSGFNLLGVFFPNALATTYSETLISAWRREKERAQEKGSSRTCTSVHGVFELAAWRVCCPLLRRTGRPLSFKIDFG